MESHEVFGRRTRIDEACNWLEPKAAIVGRFTKYNTASSSEPVQLGKAVGYQGSTEAPALDEGINCDWTKSVPTRRVVVDLHR